MPPYFDLTVGPPPTERLMNAIESERDQRHCSSQYGGILDYRVRRYKRSHQIPWDYNHGIDRLQRKLIRSLAFVYYSRCGRIEYRHDDFFRIGWIVQLQRHFRIGLRDLCFNSRSSRAKQQRRCPATSSRSDHLVQHSESGWMANLRWMRQRRRRRKRPGLWI